MARTIDKAFEEEMKRSSLTQVQIEGSSEPKYTKKGFWGRVKAWINPRAGKQVVPVGGWKEATTPDGKTVKYVDRVVSKYKSKWFQKAAITILAVSVLTIGGIAIEKNIDTPVEDPVGVEDVVTDETKDETEDNEQTDATTPEDDQTQTEDGTQTDGTGPNPDPDKDQDTDGGFVVETPEEGQDTTTPDDGFKVDTVTPPAADNTQGDTSTPTTPTTPGQDTTTPGQDTTVPTTPGQDATTNNGGGSGTPDKLADLGMVLE